MLALSRADATKAVFLITDGYSNGGDPRPAADFLKSRGVIMFTFGIQNGNVKVSVAPSSPVAGAGKAHAIPADLTSC